MSTFTTLVLVVGKHIYDVYIRTLLLVCIDAGSRHWILSPTYDPHGMFLSARITTTRSGNRDTALPTDRPGQILPAHIFLPYRLTLLPET